VCISSSALEINDVVRSFDERREIFENSVRWITKKQKRKRKLKPIYTHTHTIVSMKSFEQIALDAFIVPTGSSRAD